MRYRKAIKSKGWHALKPDARFANVLSGFFGKSEDFGLSRYKPRGECERLKTASKHGRCAVCSVYGSTERLGETAAGREENRALFDVYR